MRFPQLLRAPVIASVCVALLLCPGLAAPHLARASVAGSSTAGSTSSPAAREGTSSLESAATKAGETGRRVAMSLIGLACALAAVTLAFRRDFKQAVGVFAVGFVAVMLATPVGVSVLRDTVSSLFGSA